jgi:sporulation protein YlmC with PRC-barrel domain
LEDDLQERSLIGLEARAADGTEFGRIVEVATDEESGEVTHVVVETEDDERLEVPITSLSLDPDADFATFQADASDVEPGDHTEDEVEAQGYAPAQSDGPEDYEYENQFVTVPEDPANAQPPEDVVKESGEAGDWEDEGSLPDSGYPRNDVYIDPDTGEEQVDPLTEDNETLADDVENLIADTELDVRSAREGVVELTGAATTQEDLDETVSEIMGLDEVLEVDTTDVDVG